MLRFIGSVTGLVLLLAACGGGSDGPTGPGQPAIAAAAPPAGATGTVYPDYAFTVASGGAAPFTWSESGALPPGMAFSPAGQLTGTPVTAGTYAFTVVVTDSSVPALTASLGISLKIDAVQISPGQAPPAGVHGTPYGFVIGETGGNQPLSWTVSAGALPPGLTLGADGILTGTPTTASPTPFAFTVTVTDSSTPTPATSSAAYSITVGEPVAPTISNTPPLTATVGSPYNFQFTAIDGLAPLVWTPPSAPMGGLAISLDGMLSGTASTAGIFPITLTVKDALNQVSPVTPFTVRIAMARPAAAFVQTGSMTTPRDGHTATLLVDGRVLVAGGGLASAELYDPTSQTFTATGDMTIARIAHSATLLAKSTLPNYGKVLIAGGGEVRTELFDPTTGTFTATGDMAAQHMGQTATLLQNGQVLIAGGETASAELYNPSTGAFTATGSMTVSRSGHTATLLPDGRVLIAGGVLAAGACCTYPVPDGPGAASAELYDPVSGKFTSTGSMSEGRSAHTATLLVDGTVLVTGTDSTAELYSLGTGTFSVVGQLPLAYVSTATLFRTTATMRNDGTVLVAGGLVSTGRQPVSLTTAEFFAPECGGFVSTGSLVTARDGHTATLLADGSVLVTGGTSHNRRCRPGGPCVGSDTVLSSAELYE